MPYFGKWPEWIDLFLESCKYNKSIDWLFFTNCEEPHNKCDNVKFVNMTLSEFNNIVCSRLDVDIDFESYNYRKKSFGNCICDLKPFWSFLFADYIEEYDYWGWGDIDVIYGDICKYMEEERIYENNYDVISFHNYVTIGALSFIKNSLKMRLKPFLTIFDEYGDVKYGWKDLLFSYDVWGFEESHFPKSLDLKKCYFKESYNAPYVNNDICHNGHNRWINDSKMFPEERYWEEGKLTNNIDGDREFPYLHFTIWKGGVEGRRFGGAQWEKLKNIVNFDSEDKIDRFKINEKGFHKL
jgi:hypothetical protein